MKVCTWNVNSLNVRRDHVIDWLAANEPDVLCLQETKMVDEKFPADVFHNMNYKVQFSGQKTYNGVAIISKHDIEDPITDFPNYDDYQRRLLAGTCGPIRIINVYIPNGSEVGSEKYNYKLEWLGHLIEFVKQQIQQFEHVVLTGDYNIAPADEDVHDPELWRDKILCSKPEREKFQKLIQSGLTDTYRLFEQEPESFSWWDYRAAGFRRNLGMRIDHVLATSNLSEKCTNCAIDKEPRKLERPSDHAPVFAEFSI